MTAHNDRAARLRELHRPGDPLILPNVWDAASARVVATTGYPALATASAAIAASLGYEDHEGAPMEEMFAVAARIVRAAEDLPVTVDAEAGYGLPAADLVARLAEIGAVGCNLEDTDHGAGRLTDASAQAEYLAAVREAARANGTDLVINARVDVFLGKGEPTPEDIDAALDRGRRYLEAGADSVYPILLRDETALATLVKELPGPVNALCLPGLTVSRLAELGVARISWGPQAHRHAMGALKDYVTDLRS
ncbi:isocitrate lyase/phosphoenolpyruvate mutase family protein [Actinomadura logoneensis]|uniref:Isocitrate lyase/phosphoenolpyruvate mutase family protein n=1 Tax=Actinomadura logoneensis TaxID=2293572 RepID=A0A372JTN8_9ACTN|nr:isocitrate lyase/phosphoenolpyruvate mutase family protein [Actinomadura logoneensis]RFU42728.1 isocitrate lyase/phosphoenolpyruvate mutase family protein [Actinomadura logoneensis]